MLGMLMMKWKHATIYENFSTMRNSSGGHNNDECIIIMDSMVQEIIQARRMQFMSTKYQQLPTT
jgi:hypothetical protein